MSRTEYLGQLFADFNRARLAYEDSRAEHERVRREQSMLERRLGRVRRALANRKSDGD